MSPRPKYAPPGAVRTRGKGFWPDRTGSTRTPSAYDETYPGSELTPEQVEFGKKMHRLKCELGRTPTTVEVLRRAKRIGYTKPPPGE